MININPANYLIYKFLSDLLLVQICVSKLHSPPKSDMFDDNQMINYQLFREKDLKILINRPSENEHFHY